MGEQTVKKTYCQFCSNVCGVLVTVEDGKVVSIRGNPDNPLSRGFVCEKYASPRNGSTIPVN